MLRGLSISLILVIGALMIVRSADAIQSNEYGPELTSFLDLMRHEEDELDFQIKHNEISRPEYNRSKSRIAIQRLIVLNRFKESGVDYVPEIYVQTASEIDQVIEDGSSLIKAIKAGDVIKEKWRYLGSVRRGETFYIFERLTVK
jgi:hypothetical protein